MILRHRGLVGKDAAQTKFNELLHDSKTPQATTPSYAEVVPLLSFQWLF